jgi:hypothetical protein
LQVTAILQHADAWLSGPAMMRQAPADAMPTVARQHDRSQALASRHREPAPDHTAYGGLRPNPADNRALQTSKQLALYSETP